MSGHTKGEWNISKIGNDYEQYSIYADPQSELVANSVEGEANARLIASAPELLSACKEMHDWLSKYRIEGISSIHRALLFQTQQAINKAEVK